MIDRNEVRRALTAWRDAHEAYRAEVSRYFVDIRDLETAEAPDDAALKRLDALWTAVSAAQWRYREAMGLISPEDGPQRA